MYDIIITYRMKIKWLNYSDINDFKFNTKLINEVGICLKLPWQDNLAVVRTHYSHIELVKKTVNSVTDSCSNLAYKTISDEHFCRLLNL